MTGTDATAGMGGAPAILLYDGHCRLCVGGARRLQALARRGAVELRDFQQPGVLDAFAGLTREECLRAMVMVTPDGRRFHGAQAVAEALGTRRLIGPLARLYYLPGLRALCDAAYAWIARNRYRILGRAPACADDACALHFEPRSRSPGNSLRLFSAKRRPRVHDDDRT